MNDADISALATSEPVRYPSAEELRMIWAIALLALVEAARHGEYRATFRGFCVQALRQCPAQYVDALAEVNLCVSLGKTVVVRGLVAMTDAAQWNQKPSATVI